MNDYFSDREFGPVARINQTISPDVWAGIVAIIEGLVQSGAFGAKFPQLVLMDRLSVAMMRTH